jgi:hypothetical protein
MDTTAIVKKTLKQAYVRDTDLAREHIFKTKESPNFSKNID